MANIPHLTSDAIPVSRSLAIRYGLCEAFLIQQLHFLLCVNAKIIKGVSWHYKSYREWADELGIYGVSTVRAALKHLEDEKVVLVDNFNQKAYDQTKWYTLNYQLLGAIEDNRLSTFDTPPVNFQHTPPVNFQQTYTRDEDNKESIKEIQPSAKAGKRTSLKIPLGKQTETTVDIDMKTPSSAMAILRTVKEHNGTGPSKVNTCGSLQHYWRRLVPKHHPTVGMLPEFTKVQVGQLSHIAKALGVETDRTIQYVIPNWIGFCKFVESQAGLKKSPDVPQIGFLLKHTTEAVNYAKEGLQLTAPKKKVQVKVTPKPVVSAASVVAEESDEIADANFMLNWKPPTD